MCKSVDRISNLWSDLEVWHLLDSINLDFDDFFTISEHELCEKTDDHSEKLLLSDSNMETRLKQHETYYE